MPDPELIRAGRSLALRLSASQFLDLLLVALEERDPERAKLIAQLEESRARALAGEASEPLALEDARKEALDAERRIRNGEARKPDAIPPRLAERPPRTIVERCDEQERRMRAEGWKPIEDVIDVDEILDG